MTQNMPMSLRRAYVVMAVTAILAALFVPILSTAERLVMAAAAALLIASSASGYCACYALFTRCKTQLRR